MKTQEKTAKEQVITALVKNLRSLSPYEDWIPEHPLVVEYVQAMSESHRVYHDWNHIVDMLDEMDSLSPGIIRDPARLRAAILFHDIVCIPCAEDNEEQSTLFASKFYRGNNIALISQLILATKHTTPFVLFCDDRDTLCDIDLMTLGSDKSRFEAYRMNITEEYQGYCTPQEFDFGTKEFFLGLRLQFTRDNLYRTKVFRNRYEIHARENISRVLAGYYGS